MQKKIYLFDIEDERKTAETRRKVLRQRVNIHMTFWHNAAGITLGHRSVPLPRPAITIPNAINPRFPN